MTSPTTTTVPAPEPLLDLQRLTAGIRWRNRTWMSIGLVGLILGALLAVFLQSHTAVVRVLVVHEDEQAGAGGSLIETDVALLQTTSIAAAALEQLGVAERPERFLRTFAGEGLTDNVLEITVSASSDGDAVARAGALAQAFIADHVQRTEDAASAESRALNDRRAQAERDLDALNDEITAVMSRADADPVNAGAQLDSLYQRRSELSNQIQEFGQRADDSSIGAPRVAVGTRIVDPPRPTTASLLMTAGVNGVVGAVLGLGVGLALAAVMTLVNDRPILRRDIAAQLGASVIVQLARPRRAMALLKPLLKQRPQPDAERRRAAASLARLVRDGRRGVSLLEIGCPELTAALAFDIADDLAPDQPVVIVDELPGDHLRGVAESRTESTGDAIRLVDGAEFTAAAVTSMPGRTLGVGSVGPGAACTDLERLGSETVLVVRAGHAGSEWLHTAARNLADQEILVLGVVLVHPDPRDRTDGTLWDGLHAALRGRPRAAQQVAPQPVIPAVPLQLAPALPVSLPHHPEPTGPAPEPQPSVRPEPALRPRPRPHPHQEPRPRPSPRPRPRPGPPPRPQNGSQTGSGRTVDEPPSNNALPAGRSAPDDAVEVS